MREDRPQTITKICRRCFEVSIPLSAEFCPDCQHVHDLQILVNGIAELGVATTSARENATILNHMIDCAKKLARDT
jgi:hypothetical protein